jgi:hypothetical protein
MCRTGDVSYVWRCCWLCQARRWLGWSLLGAGLLQRRRAAAARLTISVCRAQAVAAADADGGGEGEEEGEGEEGEGAVAHVNAPSPSSSVGGRAGEAPGVEPSGALDTMRVPSALVTQRRGTLLLELSNRVVVALPLRRALQVDTAAMLEAYDAAQPLSPDLRAEFGPLLGGAAGPEVPEALEAEAAAG